MTQNANFKAPMLSVIEGEYEPPPRERSFLEELGRSLTVTMTGPLTAVISGPQYTDDLEYGCDRRSSKP